MERILQYLDDLDDLFGIFGLLAERARSLFLSVVTVAGLLLATVAGVLVALSKPPLGLAVVILLFVTLLYRSVTSPSRNRLVASRPDDGAAAIQP